MHVKEYSLGSKQTSGNWDGSGTLLFLSLQHQLT